MAALQYMSHSVSKSFLNLRKYFGGRGTQGMLNTRIVWVASLFNAKSHMVCFTDRKSMDLENHIAFPYPGRAYRLPESPHAYPVYFNDGISLINKFSWHSAYLHSHYAISFQSQQLCKAGKNNKQATKVKDTTRKSKENMAKSIFSPVPFTKHLSLFENHPCFQYIHSPFHRLLCFKVLTSLFLKIFINSIQLQLSHSSLSFKLLHSISKWILILSLWPKQFETLVLYRLLTFAFSLFLNYSIFLDHTFFYCITQYPIPTFIQLYVSPLIIKWAEASHYAHPCLLLLTNVHFLQLNAQYLLSFA